MISSAYRSKTREFRLPLFKLGLSLPRVEPWSVLARVGETAPPDLRAALVERGRSLARMHAHASFVEHAKAGALGRVILLLAKRPEVIPLVLKYGRESLLKRTGQLGFHGLRS